MRRPRSAVFPRVMMTFNRPAKGRNLDGMLSQVLRPMITALTLRGGADEEAEVDGCCSGVVGDGET